MRETAVNLARAVLNAAQPEDKIAAAQHLAQSWANGLPIGAPSPPDDYPARPVAPLCVSPGDVPRRRLGTESGRAALLHAVAHIEFNAIDLAADMLARFIFDPDLPEDDRADFAADWISVCADEARHFGMICKRLGQMGMRYGDLPAHGGLWDAALATKDNFAARLAIAPMVLEARGLDVTPAMIAKLESAGDTDSAAILDVIYTDEVGHVAIGRHWFGRICETRQHGGHADETAFFKDLVKTYFKGPLKPPFNVPARDKAHLPREFYLDQTTDT